MSGFILCSRNPLPRARDLWSISMYDTGSNLPPCQPCQSVPSHVSGPVIGRLSFRHIKIWSPGETACWLLTSRISLVTSVFPPQWSSQPTPGYIQARGLVPMHRHRQEGCGSRLRLHGQGWDSRHRLLDGEWGSHTRRHRQACGSRLRRHSGSSLRHRYLGLAHTQ